MLASMSGDRAQAKRHMEGYLGKYGPNDEVSLMLEAAMGNRPESNRLAALIDQRPFGYLALLTAVYHCSCAAPFDLESTPVLAKMLAESGLNWPPPKSLDFPHKDW